MIVTSYHILYNLNLGYMYKVSLIILLCLLCSGLSAKTVTVVKTELKSGEENSFTLNETGQISFSGRTLLIQSDENAKISTINLEDIEKLNFSNVEVSDVSQISDVKFNVYPNPVVDVLNVEVGGTVEVEILSLDGKIMKRQTVEQKGEVDMSGLAAGIYGVKLGGLIFKIEKL